MALPSPLSLVISPPGAGPDDKDQKLVITDMLPTDTIQHLKRTIAREMRRPSDWSQITLYFGKKLEDEKTLASYDIQDGDEIQQASAFPLRDTLASLPSTQVKVAPNWGIFQQKRLRQNYTRPTAAGRTIQNLAFKHINGKTFMLQDIPVRLTYRQLKEILWNEKEVDLDFYRLLYAGKQLEDGKLTRRKHQGMYG